MTGFEPAISWFVAKRVIRCATRMCCCIMLKANFVFTCYTSRFGAILEGLIVRWFTGHLRELSGEGADVNYY